MAQALRQGPEPWMAVLTIDRRRGGDVLELGRSTAPIDEPRLDAH